MRASDVDKKTAVWLLNLANDIRRIKKDSTLIDLPISTPQDTHSCIIANAFNYGCSVDPGNGIITFQSEEDVDAYFTVMGLDKSDYTYYDEDEAADAYADDRDYDYDLDVHQAPMTDELIDIAESFDSGRMFVEYDDKKIPFEEFPVVENY